MGCSLICTVRLRCSKHRHTHTQTHTETQLQIGQHACRFCTAEWLERDINNGGVEGSVPTGPRPYATVHWSVWRPGCASDDRQGCRGTHTAHAEYTPVHTHTNFSIFFRNVSIAQIFILNTKHTTCNFSFSKNRLNTIYFSEEKHRCN